MTLHIGVKAAVDGSETCTADRLDDCASVVVRAVGIGLLFVEHWMLLSIHYESVTSSKRYCSSSFRFSRREEEINRTW